MRPGARLGWICALLWLTLAVPAGAATPFQNWAAVVVAGDFHAHDGQASEGFDNARRDVSRALAAAED